MRCVGCGGRAVHQHHVVTRQHLKQYGGSPRDERNLVPVCLVCHFDHHSAGRRLPASALPPSVFEFVRELGIEWYIERYYGVLRAA